MKQSNKWKLSFCVLYTIYYSKLHDEKKSAKIWGKILCQFCMSVCKLIIPRIRGFRVGTVTIRLMTYPSYIAIRRLVYSWICLKVHQAGETLKGQLVGMYPNFVHKEVNCANKLFRQTISHCNQKWASSQKCTTYLTNLFHFDAIL